MLVATSKGLSRMAVVRWTSSSTSTPNSEPIDEDAPFNTEVSQEEIDANIKDYDKFVHNETSGQEFVKQHYKGFKDLQDKGTKTPEEQERPEDYM